MLYGSSPGRVPYGSSPDRVPDGSSPDRVPYGSSPDRVPYGPSPDRVSVYPGPCRRPRCPCRVPGRASRRPVVCQAPAQQRLEPTPPPAVYEHVFFYMPVAFNQVPVGGAAKANRWAARIPSRGRRTVPAARHHRAYPGISGHRPNIVRTSSGHFRAFPGIFGHERSSYAILSVAGSRAVRSVAGSRAVRSVAAGMARRRIASVRLVACGSARRRIACRRACRVR